MHSATAAEEGEQDGAEDLSASDCPFWQGEKPECGALVGGVYHAAHDEQHDCRDDGVFDAECLEEAN